MSNLSAMENIMTIKTTYIASAAFEAARSVSILPENHRSRRLHGHSFLATIQCAMPSGLAPHVGGEIEVMKTRLETQVAKLDYSLLNEMMSVPTDENIARWVDTHCYVPSMERIGVQSTADEGVEIDMHGRAHVWRRYAFRSVRQLANFPPEHFYGSAHSHRFEVIIHVDHKIGEGDISIDYDYLDTCWEPVSKELDCRNLNDISGLSDPSSESLACWIWTRLKPQIHDLSRVTLYETSTCGVGFDGDKFQLWNEFKFSCAVKLARASGAGVQSDVQHQSYVLRLYFVLLPEQFLSLNVANGGVQEALRPLLEQLDRRALYEIPDLIDSTTASVAAWIFNKVSVELPQIDRAELFESRGCGVIISTGSRNTILPV